MNAKSVERLLNWKRKLFPFRRLMIFVAVVIAAHLSWKLFFHTGIDNQSNGKTLQETKEPFAHSVIKEKIWLALGAGEINRQNKESQFICFLNKDLTPFFVNWAEKTTVLCHRLVNVVSGDSIFLKHKNIQVGDGQRKVSTVLTYNTSSAGVNVIWGCTGVKQIYIFFLVILFSKGIWWKRLSFFVPGALLLLLFNIVRIGTIVWCLGVYPQSFGFLHDSLFKYLFYGLIFMLWLAWEEKLSDYNWGSNRVKYGV